MDIARQLAERGSQVRAQQKGLLAEGAPEAYKDVAAVVDVATVRACSARSPAYAPWP